MTCSEWTDVVKEATQSIIAIIIIAGTLWMIASGRVTAEALGIMSTLSGAVVGYYFAKVSNGARYVGNSFRDSKPDRSSKAT